MGQKVNIYQIVFEKEYVKYFKDNNKFIYISLCENYIFFLCLLYEMMSNKHRK